MVCNKDIFSISFLDDKLRSVCTLSPSHKGAVGPQVGTSKKSGEANSSLAVCGEKCVGRSVCPSPARSGAGHGGSPRHWASPLGQGQASPSWDIILQVDSAWQGQFPGRAGLWGDGDQQQGLIPGGLEWAVGHDRMGESLEEFEMVNLRWSMHLQAHLQPSCSSLRAALSTLAGFC